MQCKCGYESAEPHPHVNGGYYAVISSEITGETYTRARKHPHCSSTTCPAPCLCHRHMLVVMSNTHIEGREEGQRGEEEEEEDEEEERKGA